MVTEEHLRIYWERRKNYSQGKHKLKENSFGITWCVICGYLSNKPAPLTMWKNENQLKLRDQLIWNKKIF